MNIKLEWNGVAYYFLDIPYGTRLLAGDGIEIKRGEERGWYFSETDFPVDQLYYTMRRVTEEYWKLTEPIDGLPERVDRLIEISRELAIKGFVLYRYDDDYRIEGDSPYEFVREYTTEQHPIQGEWMIRQGKPKQPVNFSWSATFPDNIRQQKEILHLFPCRVIWDQSGRKWLENCLKVVIGNQGDVYNLTSSGFSVYIKNDRGSIVYSQKDWHPKEINGDDLDDLKEKLDAYVKLLEDTFAVEVHRARTPCPRCNGTGTATSLDTHTLDATELETLRVIRSARNSRNGKDMDKIKQLVERLAQIARASNG